MDVEDGCPPAYRQPKWAVPEVLLVVHLVFQGSQRLFGSESQKRQKPENNRFVIYEMHKQQASSHACFAAAARSTWSSS